MKAKLLALTFAALFVPSVASSQTYQPYSYQPYSSQAPQRQQTPQSGRSYDPQSGNSYSWRTDSNGNTTVRGNNFQTGSTWTNRIDRNGNQSGTDANGNYWRYNAQSGSYTSTDGTICTGKGASRICN
jgi:hypothetical protein